jgi:hypothetical protein
MRLLPGIPLLPGKSQAAAPSFPGCCVHWLRHYSTGWLPEQATGPLTWHCIAGHSCTLLPAAPVPCTPPVIQLPPASCSPSPVHRQADNIYGGSREEVLFRCALLSKAALEAPWVVPCGGAVYGEDNLVFVANDWHTSLLPFYLQVPCGQPCYGQGVLQGSFKGYNLFCIVPGVAVVGNVLKPDGRYVCSLGCTSRLPG